MKNLLKTISLLILLAGLFASCKTGSVIKRHYNKGYYVSKKHKPSEPHLAQSTTKEKATTPANAPALEPSVIENIAADPEAPSQTETVTQATEPKLNDQSQSNVKASGMEFFPKEDGVTSSLGSRKFMTHPFRSIKNLKAAVKQDDLARDALSLIWIVIVVLLVLYIVGLIFDLFGVGPVFHILGGIILVLLVLWLLRII